jgi:hypothetical protein
MRQLGGPRGLCGQRIIRPSGFSRLITFAALAYRPIKSAQRGSQMRLGRRSLALPHFLNDTPAAQYSTAATGKVLGALILLSGAKHRFVFGHMDAHPVGDLRWSLALKAQRVFEKGFDGSVHGMLSSATVCGVIVTLISAPRTLPARDSLTNKSKKWANRRDYPIGPVCSEEKGPGQGTGAVRPRPALQRNDNGANISG